MGDDRRQQAFGGAGLEEIRDEAVPIDAGLGKAFLEEAMWDGIMPPVDRERIAGTSEVHGNARTEAAMTAGHQCQRRCFPLPRH